MEHTETEYMAILREALPTSFLKALLTSVVTAHRAAYSQTKRTFDQPASRHNLLGHIRREKLHEEALALGERFGIKAEMKPYGRGSGYYLLVSAGRIFLVVCVVQSRKTMVRDSEYRRVLARLNDSGQRNFSFIPPDTQAEDGQYLCVLIHGRRRGKDYPAFVDIAFPHKSFENWMCRLNLFQEFPDLVEKLIVQRDEEAHAHQKKHVRRKSA